MASIKETAFLFLPLLLFSVILGIASSQPNNNKNINDVDASSHSKPPSPLEHPYFGMFHQLQLATRLGRGVQQKELPEGRELERLLRDLDPRRLWLEGLMGNSLLNLQAGPDGPGNSPLLSVLQEAGDADNVTSRCINDTARTIFGLFEGETWAAQMLDATGKPGPALMEFHFNWVGNYQQCRAVQAPAILGNGSKDEDGFGGNYCVLGAFINVGPPSIFAPKGFEATVGVCVPDTCSDQELTRLLENVLQATESKNQSFKLHDAFAEIRNDHREVTVATVLAIVMLSILYGLVALGTAYDIIVIQLPKWRSVTLIGDSLGDESKSSYQVVTGRDENGIGGVGGEATPLLPKEKPSSSQRVTGTLIEALLAFSAYTNGSKVLSTKQPPGALTAVHGIRFLSMTWVMLGHVLVFGSAQMLNLTTRFSKLLDRWTFDAIANAFDSVDSFFTLSGLLTSYLTILEMKKRGWKINWGLFYFHRFWRLTPPYMLVLLIVLGLQRFMGSGPLWPATQPSDKQFCEDNWWTNLLYINNLVRKKSMCFGHSWYLANDMQFFIVSPLMLIPFFFRWWLGVASCLVFLLTTWITTGALSTHNEWPASILSPHNQGPGAMTAFFDYYIVPWCRIGPYVVGILAGYILALTNGGRFRMKWYVALLGWAIATATGLACVYGLRGDLSGEHPNTVQVNAFYNAMSRSAWGAALCWVIIACAAGYGGPVNALLSWSPFVVLGRLTYMSYLIHPAIMYVYFQNMDALYFLNDTNMVIIYLGIVFFTYMAAFVLMLGLESPMIGLEKVFLGKSKKS